MNTCSNCGNAVRPQAQFCTKCGCKFEAAPEGGSAGGNVPVSDIPLVALAPIERLSIGRRIGRFMRLFLSVILVAALCLGGIAISVLISASPAQNPFVEVDKTVYREALSLVEDVRNPAFSSVIDEVMYQSGEAENYEFLTEYKDKFKGMLTEQSSEEEENFAKASYYVFYAEYLARRYEYLAGKNALFRMFYQGKADKYRGYADHVYNILKTAESDIQLQNITMYCEEREIAPEW
ncbi:MAG: zinc ribbon domain-containing protein [Oscillospiraceae bacterium]|jgi:hypothetical protein|nr:zinc ribbon domain-containing protein [Oscillospiraceae bacterium]